LSYRIGETVFDPHQNVNLILCHHEVMPSVEIIYPAFEKSRLDGLFTRHPSGLVYHICFTSAGLASSLSSLEADGLKTVCVSPPKPAVLFGGKLVSFYIVAGMGLIEIIDNSMA
jgi:methylmalonyl-CoA/ethylmalonyl-CoA epimerase